MTVFLGGVGSALKPPFTCTVEEMAQLQKMIAHSVAFHYILKTPMHFEHAGLACGRKLLTWRRVNTWAQTAEIEVV